MLVPRVGLRFYISEWKRLDGSMLLCEIIEIRDEEIVRYKPVDSDAFVGEVHVNFFHRVVQALPA